MVVRYSKIAEKTSDMDDTPIDANVAAVSSKRKYGNMRSHEHENCRAEIQPRIKTDMFDKLAVDADLDFVQYLTGEMMSIMTDVNYEGVNDNAVDTDPHYEIKTDMFDKPAVDADIDFVQYLTGEMMSIMTDVNYEGTNDNAVDTDPHYEIFLDSVKVDGHSYVLEVSAKNGLSEPLKYEARDESDDEMNKGTRRKQNNTIGGNVGDDTNSSNYTDSSLVFKTKDALPVVCEAVSHSMKGSPKLPIESGQSDPSVEGDDSCQYLGSPSRERNSLFRKQLMRILGKPYDKNEHQMLLEDIQARKPVERHMELRFRREQSYAINKDGKSYLDHYYDLKRKLEAAKTSGKKLILLRGFFFWLQNLTQEGAFKPWQDESCLAL